MPFCPKPDVCGSCGWAHIPYPKQLQQKLSDINGSFKLKKLATRVEEIFPSPKIEHYRNRMDFVIDFEGRVGLREKGKWWKVIDNHTCFLGDERIEELFVAVREWVHSCGLSFYDRKAHTGLLRYAVIRATTTGDAMITIVTSKPAENERQKIASSLALLVPRSNTCEIIWSVNDTESDVSHVGVLETIRGKGYVEETINQNRYRITPNAFFQTNSHAAALLQQTVLDFAGAVHDKRVLDLYCGSGFFSIPFAKHGAHVVGMESVEEAIRDARVNAELNGAEIAFTTAVVEETDWSIHKPELLLLDPPRMGLHDRALEAVIKHAPPAIVYVSCNYKNFARELVILEKTYRVSAMRAIDMFPHTPHVELVSLLTKR
ncbi:23S rRNA (uracil(1939)-C(5))-methyltransferase RlmD [Candidatus Uhrbacteria bacterium]|nr:23S rRNA (uracil(1939)-C(5))-methyltransferase RlmD [Candidatus Uhrbacteria bacterium]